MAFANKGHRNILWISVELEVISENKIARYHLGKDYDTIMKLKSILTGQLFGSQI